MDSTPTTFISARRWLCQLLDHRWSFSGAVDRLDPERELLQLVCSRCGEPAWVPTHEGDEPTDTAAPKAA
jgi:hypothetical protein